MSAEASQQPQRPRRSRSKAVKPGRLPISEATSDRAGAGSPFGDDVTFPLPLERLNYEHPRD
jgi:succinate dehydrogenase / fumarate reductase iron-sulfur subunit